MGVPFVSDTGITWGSERAPWSEALRAMVTPCVCSVPNLMDSAGLMRRCDRCYGQRMIVARVVSLGCGLCGALSDSTCVVCSRGIHWHKSMTCHGANIAYCADELEGLTVCPDCIWEWTNSLSSRDDVAMQPCQSTAFSIMNKAAMAFQRTRSGSLSVQAINECIPPILTGRSADIEVGLLFQDKSLGVLDGVCTWKTSGSSPSKRARKGKVLRFPCSHQ